MSDVLDEAYGVVQCKQCTWYKTCVVPMRLTAEDIRRQLEASTPGMDTSPQANLSIQNLLSNMATAAQNSMLEGCPIFIERLRGNPELAQYIKKMMQGSGLFKNYTLQGALDRLDVIECFESPGQKLLVGEVLEKQNDTYAVLDIASPASL